MILYKETRDAAASVSLCPAFPNFLTLDHLTLLTHTNIHMNINTMEDFNQPIPERVDMLKRLQEAIGNVTPQFWAACQICDLGMLNRLLQEEKTVILHGFSYHFCQMVRYCKSITYVSLL